MGNNKTAEVMPAPPPGFEFMSGNMPEDVIPVPPPGFTFVDEADIQPEELPTPALPQGFARKDGSNLDAPSRSSWLGPKAGPPQAGGKPKMLSGPSRPKQLDEMSAPELTETVIAHMGVEPPPRPKNPMPAAELPQLAGDPTVVSPPQQIPPPQVPVPPQVSAKDPMYKKEQAEQQAPPPLPGVPAPPPAPKYSTQLLPQQEAAFWPWKAQNAPTDSGDTIDLRGAFKAGATKDKLGNWPEQFRKPNHPQFTINSIYAKDAPDKAGHINGNVYVPPEKKETLKPGLLPETSQQVLKPARELDMSERFYNMIDAGAVDMFRKFFPNLTTQDKALAALQKPESQPSTFLKLTELGPKGEPTTVTEGLAQGTLEVLEGIASPEGIALLVGNRYLGPAVKAAIAGGFTADMAWNLVQQVPEAVELWNKGQHPQAAKVAVHALSSLVFGGLGAKHIAKGMGGRPPLADRPGYRERPVPQGEPQPTSAQMPPQLTGETGPPQLTGTSVIEPPSGPRPSRPPVIDLKEVAPGVMGVRPPFAERARTKASSAAEKAREFLRSMRSKEEPVNVEENRQGVPSEVGVGQEPVQTQPIEAAGAEASRGSGNVQAPQEGQVAEPAAATAEQNPNYEAFKAAWGEAVAKRVLDPNADPYEVATEMEALMGGMGGAAEPPPPPAAPPVTTTPEPAAVPVPGEAAPIISSEPAATPAPDPTTTEYHQQVPQAPYNRIETPSTVLGPERAREYHGLVAAQIRGDANAGQALDDFIGKMTDAERDALGFQKPAAPEPEPATTPVVEPTTPVVEPQAPVEEPQAAVVEAPAPEVPQPAPKPAGEPTLTFQTSKGSTYKVYEDGTTVRNKTLHAGHDPKDVGIKERSELTVYVNPNDAGEIGGWGQLLTGVKGRRIVLVGDKIYRTSINPKTGKRGRDGPPIDIVSYSPRLGLAPVELREPSQSVPGGWRWNHPGNEITSMGGEPQPAAATPAAPPKVRHSTQPLAKGGPVRPPVPGVKAAAPPPKKGAAALKPIALKPPPAAEPAPAPAAVEEMPQTSAQVLGEKLGKQYDDLMDAPSTPANLRAIDKMEAAMTPEQRKALNVPEKEGYKAPPVPKSQETLDREADAEGDVAPVEVAAPPPAKPKKTTKKKGPKALLDEPERRYPGPAPGPLNRFGVPRAIPASNLPSDASLGEVIDAAFARAEKRKGGDPSGRVWINNAGQRLINHLLGIPQGRRWMGLSLSADDIGDMRAKMLRSGMATDLGLKPAHRAKGEEFLKSIEDTLSDSPANAVTTVAPAVPGEAVTSHRTETLKSLRRINLHEGGHGTQARLGNLKPFRPPKQGEHPSDYAWDHTWWENLPHAETMKEKLGAFNYDSADAAIVSTEIASALADGSHAERLGLNDAQATEVAQHLYDAVEAHHGENALAILRGWSLDSLARLFESRPGLKERYEAYEKAGGIERAEKAKAEAAKAAVPAARRPLKALNEPPEQPEPISKEEANKVSPNYEETKKRMLDKLAGNPAAQADLKQVFEKWEKGKTPEDFETVGFDKAKAAMEKQIEDVFGPDASEVKKDIDWDYYQREGRAAADLGRAAHQRATEVNAQRYRREVELGKMVNEEHVNVDAVKALQKEINELTEYQRELSDFAFKMKSDAGRNLVYFRTSAAKEPFDPMAAEAKARGILKLHPKESLPKNIKKDLDDLSAEGKEAWDKAKDKVVNKKKRDEKRKEIWKKKEAEDKKEQEEQAAKTPKTPGSGGGGKKKEPTREELFAAEKARILRKVQKEMDRLDGNWRKHPDDPSKWTPTEDERQRMEEDPDVLAARRKLANKYGEISTLGRADLFWTWHKSLMLKGMGHFIGQTLERARVTKEAAETMPEDASFLEKAKHLAKGSGTAPKVDSNYEKYQHLSRIFGSGSGFVNAVSTAANMVAEEGVRPFARFWQGAAKRGMIPFASGVTQAMKEQGRDVVGPASWEQTKKAWSESWSKDGEKGKGRKAAEDMLRSGITERDLKKTDIPRTVNPREFKGGFLAKLGNVFQRKMARDANYVHGGMAAADRFNKEVAQRRSELETENLPGWENDPRGRRLRAERQRDISTLNDPTHLGGWISQAKRNLLREKEQNMGKKIVHTGLGSLMEFTMPFVNTLINVADIGAAFSPFGFATRPVMAKISTYDKVLPRGAKSVIDKESEKGWTQEDSQKFGDEVREKLEKRNWDEENLEKLFRGLGSATAGTMIVALGALLRHNDLITGGYDDDKDDRGKQNVRTAAGAKPLTWRGGGRYTTYAMAPFAPGLAMGADIYDAMVGKKTYGAMTRGATEGTLNAAIDMVGSLPMFQQIGKGMKMLQNAERHGWGPALAEYGGELGSSFIGPAHRNIADLSDDVRRDTRNREHTGEGGMNLIKSRLPWIRKSLPPKVNAMGQVEKRDLGLIFSPVGTTKGKDFDETTALGRATKELRRVQAGVDYPQQGKSESNEDYQKRAEAIGRAVANRIDSITKTPEYQALTIIQQKHRLSFAAKEAANKPYLRPPKEKQKKQTWRNAAKEEEEGN